MHIYRRGVLTALGFAVVFAAAMRLHADLLVRVVIWSVILTASIFAIVRKVIRGKPGSYSTADALPSKVKRWVLDEPEDAASRK